MLDRPDLEDHREEGQAIGKCASCSVEIMEWEDYYDIDGLLIHDDCGIKFLNQFKRYA